MFSEQQKRFAFEYLVDYQAGNAARRAGYSDRSADAQACELLKKPEVQAEIERLREREARRRRRDKPWLLDILGDIADCPIVQCPKCWPKELREMMGAAPNPECSGCAGKGIRLEKPTDRIAAGKVYANLMGWEMNNQQILAAVQVTRGVELTASDEELIAVALGVSPGVPQLKAPVTLEGS